jgi:hypothetical protein
MTPSSRAGWATYSQGRSLGRLTRFTAAEYPAIAHGFVVVGQTEHGSYSPGGRRVPGLIPGTLTQPDASVGPLANAQKEHHRPPCPVRLSAVQVAALAVQRGWYIRMSPYRMRRRAEQRACQPRPGRRYATVSDVRPEPCKVRDLRGRGCDWPRLVDLVKPVVARDVNDSTLRRARTRSSRTCLL